eukprot:6465830-Amphidinium_carterae.1
MGHMKRHRRVPLPIVALACGLTGKCWAEEWLKLREALAVDDKDCCLPIPSMDGQSFLDGPLRSSTAAIWLINAVRELSPNALPVTTHGCRATVLSWAAKHGMSTVNRKLLGYHVQTRDRTMMEYSRDCLATPLRELTSIYQKIRDEVFKPDVTRSGHFPTLGD